MRLLAAPHVHIHLLKLVSAKLSNGIILSKSAACVFLKVEASKHGHLEGLTVTWMKASPSETK